MELHTKDFLNIVHFLMHKVMGECDEGEEDVVAKSLGGPMSKNCYFFGKSVALSVY